LSKKVCFFLTHTIENYFENYSLLTSWESYLDFYSACGFTFLPIGCNSIWGFSAIESFACSRSVVAFRLSASSSSNQIGGLLISSDIEKGAYKLLGYIDSEESILKGNEVC
jgi:hypothetical protein